MRQEDDDPDEAINDEDIISPAIIRKRLGLSQRGFADAIHVPIATPKNREQERTIMDPSARVRREPKAASRALGHQRVTGRTGQN
jgi:putative transcriptional regulator